MKTIKFFIVGLLMVSASMAFAQEVKQTNGAQQQPLICFNIVKPVCPDCTSGYLTGTIRLWYENNTYKDIPIEQFYMGPEGATSWSEGFGVGFAVRATYCFYFGFPDSPPIILADFCGAVNIPGGTGCVATVNISAVAWTLHESVGPGNGTE